jgi:hypothetical protein
MRIGLKTGLYTTMGICLVAHAGPARAEGGFADAAIRQQLVESRTFIQIPGPNPVLTPGPKGSWDDGVIESSDAFKDIGTYYFYYHGAGQGQGYRLGVASSDHPLGPFKKHGDKPILEVGPKGSWESIHVACALVRREGPDKYCMWYSGMKPGEHAGIWGIGLATASHPLGPWTKYEGNPVIDHFGYLGGVVKVDGKYMMYTAHPISWDGYHNDYSPLAVAVADRPEGPWKKYEKNPLMVKGADGEWGDGGISEAEVLYENGMFHMFYGATPRYGPRTEHVGYAYSFDGYKFFKHGFNPIVSREAAPNAAAFAEIHAIIERPFIYLYHTLRYKQKDNLDHPWIEDLGVQVLATQRPFSLNMPVIHRETLAPGETTSLDAASPVALGHVTRASLTAECRFAAGAKEPLTLHVRSSYDGVTYDTDDLVFLMLDVQPGKKVVRTIGIKPNVRFIKVFLENLDKNQSVSNVVVTASLNG